ncbi:hypothetical protein [Photobacterium marinum]|nr:hypothetical protein [Photobacterium marinum]
MKKLLILLLLITPFHGLLAKEIGVYVDDKDVIQDTYYPGCFWDHCKDKAQKLEKHYLQRRVYSELGKDRNYTFKRVSSERIDNGLKITISTVLAGSGRGYAELAIGTLTLGAAPMKVEARFVVEYELYKDGKMMQEFYEERNISVLVDTQKYKKKAAKKIAEFSGNFVRG